MIQLIFIILIFFLFLRKNCNNQNKENFNNIITRNHISSYDYFNFLQNDVKQKQAVRNLLF
jgi:hypothetical protein